MDQRLYALVAIAVVIPISILWVLQTGGELVSGRVGVNGNVTEPGPHRIRVVASFFPLYDFARQIGGDSIDASSLVPIGVEPHDWEPTLSQSIDLKSADLFVYNGAGIDRWADRADVRLKVSVSSGEQLLVDSTGNADPHTWLDPILAKRQVELIRNGLIQADPQNTEYYSEHAKSYLDRLDTLDGQIRSSFLNCNKTDFIAFHSAFSYFANRYGLHQHTILGGDPEGDIPPQTLTELVQFARQYGIHVIYSEELLDPRNAETIANSIPAGKVLILSPVEGVDKEELDAGIGYIEKMKLNIENLKVGLECK